MNSINNIPVAYIVEKNKPLEKYPDFSFATIRSRKDPYVFFSFGSSYIKYNKNNTFNILLPSDAFISTMNLTNLFDSTGEKVFDAVEFDALKKHFA